MDDSQTTDGEAETEQVPEDLSGTELWLLARQSYGRFIADYSNSHPSLRGAVASLRLPQWSGLTPEVQARWMAALQPLVAELETLRALRTTGELAVRRANEMQCARDKAFARVSAVAGAVEAAKPAIAEALMFCDVHPPLLEAVAKLHAAMHEPLEVT